jgi:hypothetical protein
MAPPDDTVPQSPKAKFAALFSDAVESFGLVHQNKKGWDLAQRLLLARLGIEQGRLLACGDALRICHPGYMADPNEILPLFEAMCQHLEAIRACFFCENKQSYFRSYGLRPAKGAVDFETALHMTRLEAFRERYQILDLKAPKNPQIHWIIVDNAKFPALIGKLQAEVDALVVRTGVERNVDLAMRRDIRALGWHPLFDRPKAASDGSKLQLIREVCATDYPEYSAATREPLAYLAKEWQDSYQEAIIKLSARARAANVASSSEQSAQKRPSRPSIFQQIRSSWRKPKPASDTSTTVAGPPDPLQEDAADARSKSSPVP